MPLTSASAESEGSVTALLSPGWGTKRVTAGGYGRGMLRVCPGSASDYPPASATILTDSSPAVLQGFLLHRGPEMGAAR